MVELWNTLLIAPLMNAMVLLYRYVGNLGLAIILLSFFVRLVMVPFFIPNLKMAKKQLHIKKSYYQV